MLAVAALMAPAWSGAETEFAESRYWREVTACVELPNPEEKPREVIVRICREIAIAKLLEREIAGRRLLFDAYAALSDEVGALRGRIDVLEKALRSLAEEDVFSPDE